VTRETFRSRVARKTNVARTEPKKRAPSGVRRDGGPHSATLPEIVGFAAIDVM
jgi:hypothetical protein